MRRHVVVDGSNIATEGRSIPSLAQLDQAVREFMDENPDVTITVVVDATFGHRIDPSEQRAFDEAEANNEVVSPPAGAIGRGDAFVLRIADKVGGSVLSNDSFQEFHGEYEWLFDEGRLVGGKPVPGVGWVFTLRTPVRGPKSREAVKEAKRKKAKERSGDHDEHGLELAAKAKEAKPKSKRQVERAIEVATDEAVEPDSDKLKRRRRRRAVAPPSDPINDPEVFFGFLTAHRLGTQVQGEVEAFTSHGAFVTVDGARCYIPLSALADPAPRAAKEVLRKGETRGFVIQAFDPPRRGIELALPELVHVRGAPTDETVEAEISERPEPARPPKSRRRGKGGREEEAAELVLEPAGANGAEPGAAPAKRGTRRRAAAPEVPAAEHGAATEAAAPAPRSRKRTATAAAKAAPVPEATSAETPVEPAAPARTGITRGPASIKKAGAREDAAKKAPAKAVARSTTKPAAKSTAKKAAAPARAAKAKGAPGVAAPSPLPAEIEAEAKRLARSVAAKKAAATRAAKKAAAGS